MAPRHLRQFSLPTFQHVEQSSEDGPLTVDEDSLGRNPIKMKTLSCASVLSLLLVIGCSDDETTSSTTTGSGGGASAGGTGGSGVTTNSTGGSGGSAVSTGGSGGSMSGGCGDGTLDMGEQCDDGNTTGGDGCSATCMIEAITSCGDGTLDPPQEECDDGNTTAGDGCDSTCQLEPVGQNCGDTPGAGEKCDDGNLLNGDGCNPTCNFFGRVTELAVGVPGNVITSDGTYLYVYGMSGNCQIHRASIALCNAGTCAFTPLVGVAGCNGTPTDGPGATAILGGGAGGLTFGAGRLYFADAHAVRSVDLASPSLTVTTIAGDPNRCGQLDGVGANAVFSDVRGLTFYNGLIYAVDANMATLRSIDPSTGTVTTLAGQTPNDNANTNYSCSTMLCCGNTAMAMDGVGTAAIMNSPRYITQDNGGSLFIMDTNGSAIRTYNVANNTLTTIVGGVGYVDGVGTAVRMDRPRGITSDGTSLYFGEQNLGTLRQIELGTSTTSTFVGVRGCIGPQNLMGGTGGDGSQSWTGNCQNPAVGMKPQFDVGPLNLTFDYGTQSIYAVGANNRLLRVE